MIFGLTAILALWLMVVALAGEFFTRGAIWPFTLLKLGTLLLFIDAAAFFSCLIISLFL